MANRLIRSTAILGKLETVYGEDAVPAGGADALEVGNLSINPINAQTQDTDLVRPYLGSSPKYMGSRYVEMGFDVFFAGAGTVATAPAWGKLMRACAFAETLTATIRCDHTPITDGQESITLYWYDAGVLHAATGAMGNPSFSLKIGEIPKISFKFVGLYTRPTVATNPAITLTAWKKPQVVLTANSGVLTLGATHSATLAPAFVGGTGYPSQGLELDMGNAVNFTALLGGEKVDITARDSKGKVTLDLTAAQEVALITEAETGALQSLGLLHGTVANHKVGLWMPAVQLSNPQKAEVNGKRLITFDYSAQPLDGNDEVRVISSF